ncbi:MAG: hypothetical protein AAB511_03740 [Patescibacteria group bacterium]
MRKNEIVCIFLTGIFVGTQMFPSPIWFLGIVVSFVIGSAPLFSHEEGDDFFISGLLFHTTIVALSLRTIYLFSVNEDYVILSHAKEFVCVGLVLGIRSLYRITQYAGLFRAPINPGDSNRSN